MDYFMEAVSKSNDRADFGNILHENFVVTDSVLEAKARRNIDKIGTWILQELMILSQQNMTQEKPGICFMGYGVDVTRPTIISVT